MMNMRSQVRALMLASLPVLLALGAVRAEAQGWVLDGSAGHSSNAAAPADVQGLGTALGLRYEGSRWLYLSAGVPFDAGGVPWGALGLGSRVSSSRGRLGIGMDGSGQAFGYRDPSSGAGGGGLVLEAMPLVSGTVGVARAELRSGLLHYSRSYAGEAVSRTVHQTDARLGLDAAPFAFAGEARYLRAPEGDYPYLGATAEASAGRGAVWGYMGRWLSDAVETPVWGAGATFPTAGRTEVFASVQQGTNDPLYWTPPRRTWSAGVSLRLGRSGQASSAPIRPAVGAGGVNIRIPLSASADAPALFGDFTGWKPIPMTRSGEFWEVSLAVAPGVYRYAFRSADGRWFVPESVAGRVDDGMGGVSAVLVVPR
jgi:hypothetical protein